LLRYREWTVFQCLQIHHQETVFWPPCTSIDALVSLIGSRGAAVEEKKNIRN
jgi:hypothetical protein